MTVENPANPENDLADAEETATDTAETRTAPKSGGFALKLGHKTSLVVVFVTALGIGLLSAYNLFSEKKVLHSSTRAGNQVITELLASQIGGGVAWKKTEVIERAYEALAKDPGTNLAAIMSFDKDGAPITRFQSGKLAAYDLSGVLKAHGKALDAGKTVTLERPSHTVMIAPVVIGQAKKRVGTLAVAWNTESITAYFDRKLVENGAISVALVALLAIVLYVFIGRVIGSPIVRMIRCMSALADGDEVVDVPDRGRRDEIGGIARAVQFFKEQLIENREMREKQEEQDRLEVRRRERAAAEKMEADAEAEEQRRQADERAALLSRLTAEFESEVAEALSTVSTASQQLNATARSMNDIARDTSDKSSSVSVDVDEAAQNVNTVAAASEELSATVKEIARQVQQSTETARTAVDEAGRANEKVQGLADSAIKIGEVVDLINDIASQTNLLALNATIEAARAGEAGKGFAVVASEVKSLASQTAKATEDISGQISAIQGATNEAVDAIQLISRTINQISEVTTAIAAAVEEQSASVGEIASSAQLASNRAVAVSETIGGVSSAAEQTGDAASQVLKAAGEVSEKSDRLRHAVETFLSGVRAA